MLRYRFVVLLTLFVFCVASAALSQEPPAFDADACAKHCREMAAARAKNVEACKAHMQQRDAAWKEIEAQLQLARTSRGDKKVAALEAAVQKLVAYNASAPAAMVRLSDDGRPRHGVRLLCRAQEIGCRQRNERLLRRGDEGLLGWECACRKQPPLSDDPGIAGAFSGSLKGPGEGRSRSGRRPGLSPRVIHLVSLNDSLDSSRGVQCDETWRGWVLAHRSGGSDAHIEPHPRGGCRGRSSLCVRRRRPGQLGQRPDRLRGLRVQLSAGRAHLRHLGDEPRRLRADESDQHSPAQRDVARLVAGRDADRLRRGLQLRLHDPGDERRRQRPGADRGRALLPVRAELVGRRHPDRVHPDGPGAGHHRPVRHPRRERRRIR